MENLITVIVEHLPSGKLYTISQKDLLKLEGDNCRINCYEFKLFETEYAVFELIQQFPNYELRIVNLCKCITDDNLYAIGASEYEETKENDKLMVHPVTITNVPYVLEKHSKFIKTSYLAFLWYMNGKLSYYN